MVFAHDDFQKKVYDRLSALVQIIALKDFENETILLSVQNFNRRVFWKISNKKRGRLAKNHEHIIAIVIQLVVVKTTFFLSKLS